MGGGRPRAARRQVLVYEQELRGDGGREACPPPRRQGWLRLAAAGGSGGSERVRVPGAVSSSRSHSRTRAVASQRQAPDAARSAA